MENAAALWRVYTGDIGRPIQMCPLFSFPLTVRDVANLWL